MIFGTLSTRCDWSDERESRDVLDADSLRGSVAVGRHLPHDDLLRAGRVRAVSARERHQSRRPHSAHGRSALRHGATQRHPPPLRRHALPGTTLGQRSRDVKARGPCGLEAKLLGLGLGLGLTLSGLGLDLGLMASGLGLIEIGLVASNTSLR